MFCKVQNYKNHAETLKNFPNTCSLESMNTNIIDIYLNDIKMNVFITANCLVLYGTSVLLFYLL